MERLGGGSLKPKIINGVLWLAFFLALAASVSHLAYTFGTVERNAAWGWVSAIAVDTGLAALAYTIQQRKTAKRKTASLWAGVAFFAGISALANFYHALSVESGGAVAVSSLYSADWLELAKAVILSATLPAMVIYLGEIVSGDDATASEALKRKSEREQRKSELEAERLLLAEQNEAKRLVIAVAQSEWNKAESEMEAVEVDAGPVEIRWQCDHCKQSFSTQNALNAHSRKHAPEKVNGKS